MSVSKYIAVVSGIQTEVEFTVTSTGAPDAGKGVGLGADGKLDASVMPTGVGPVAVSITAFENISAGLFVNIFQHAGIAKVRKADYSSADTSADGFIKVDATANNPVVVYLPGNINPNLSALSKGVTYYLGATGVPISDPSGIPANGIVQILGKSTNDTALCFVNTLFNQKIP